MKKFILSGGLFFFLAVCSYAQNGTSLEKETGEWGTKCSSKDSYQISLRNVSTEAVDVQIAVQGTDGTWSCWGQSNLQPNEVTSCGSYNCHSTGKVLWWYRSAGDWSTKLPSSDYINENY